MTTRTNLRRVVVFLALATATGLAGCAANDADAVADAVAEAGPRWLECGEADGAPIYSQIEVGELKTMNIACQGKSGAPVLLLHGFPDYAYGWHKVMSELAADHIVIAPDQRGYHTTWGPDDVAGFHIDKLVDDVKALIERATATKDGTAAPGEMILVGHDWGGAVAWTFASRHPDLIVKLVIMNAPHPDIFMREYNDNPDQHEASSYMAFFNAPGSEAVLKANDHQLLIDAFGDALTETEKAAYRELYAASDLVKMLNWYRANVDTDKGEMSAKNLHVTVPTLVAWGMKDAALLPGNLIGLDAYVTDLTLQQFPTATHWIAHEQPQAVAKAIRDFAAGLAIPATASEQ